MQLSNKPIPDSQKEPTKVPAGVKKMTPEQFQAWHEQVSKEMLQNLNRKALEQK